jgi:hypothetical protein
MMGLDFIHSAVNKPWRRGWATALDQLRQPTLFDVVASESSRTVQADCHGTGRIAEGAAVLLELRDDGLIVTSGHEHIGIVANPPAEVIEAVRELCGVHPALVERIGTFGRTIDLILT